MSFRRRAGFLLATVGRRTEAAWGGFLRSRGMTNAEFAALAVLVDGSASQVELARQLAIDARNAGATVGRLRERGWLSSEADTADRRRVVLTLTPEGRRAWDGLQSELRGSHSDYFSVLDETERTELERLLNKLNDAHVGHG
ncbi:MarR family winged helix-turn-helix transcriptional regulator [Serinicoccus kebangsaanensis]|uniref:MarR family winged helix-turn-helix transcriptional regulator n=1 Tax=Serinicoccus kebangsaanensis TaxID=2602069 RepID=UPI00192D5EA3|nr:MarR family transcriptional regulator [Serinicoccus kebangsaanensis]